MQAVAQVCAIDIKAKTPMLDVDMHRTGLIFKALERAQVQGCIAQLLVNLAGGQGRHGCLRAVGEGDRIERAPETVIRRSVPAGYAVPLRPAAEGSCRRSFATNLSATVAFP
ncbi:hypothetical protein D3C71_1833640 [compost metagenome]